LSYVLREFASAAELHHCAPAWDDLWQRSDHTSALFRAAMVTQWLEQFGPHQRSRILVVEDQGQMVAGVPLCQRRAARVLPVADVTLNYWSPNGDLLVDPQADVAAAMRVLLEGLERAPWPLLWFDCVPFEWPNWQALVTAAEQAGWTRLVRPRYCVGQVNLATGFDACETCWSKNHRRNLRRDMRRLEERGPVRLALHRHSTPAEVEPLLRRAFEIEDRGWKGREGTSVLHAPAIFQFFVRQGQQLAVPGVPGSRRATNRLRIRLDLQERLLLVQDRLRRGLQPFRPRTPRAFESPQIAGGRRRASGRLLRSDDARLGRLVDPELPRRPPDPRPAADDEPGPAGNPPRAGCLAQPAASPRRPAGNRRGNCRALIRQ
jgi:hypothetical protein